METSLAEAIEAWNEHALQVRDSLLEREAELLRELWKVKSRLARIPRIHGPAQPLAAATPPDTGSREP